MFKINEGKKSLLGEYINFCCSPLRTERQTIGDFQSLKEKSFVTHLAFHNPSVLMVGTKPVLISYAGKRYVIGEFIIFLVRHYVDGYWEVDFRFWNVTNQIPQSWETKEDVHTQFILHPHIVTDCFAVGAKCRQIKGKNDSSPDVGNQPQSKDR